MSQNPRPRALDGCTVLDFSRHMAGPYATAMLADHGADVIKVDGLPDGDPSRAMGVGGRIGGESGTFLMWNRGKRSIAIDLRRAEGVEVARAIARRADVVVENYRPGIADSIGIGYETLSAINPRLVYCSVSAFGSSGPLAHLPGTDPVVQAMSGIMSVTGEPEGEGVLVGAPVADFTGSMYAVQGILMALLARERTGVGQLVDVSMLYGMLSMFSTRLAWHWSTGLDPQRFGSAHNTLVPYESFRTADGAAMAGTWGHDSWPKFCAAIDRPDLVTDPRFLTNDDRRTNHDELASIVGDVMCKRSTEDWARRFDAAGALFAPVTSLSEILAHPQVAQADLVQTVNHPDLGEIPQLAPVVRLSHTNPRISRHPPRLGEHTREVLMESGYSTQQIEQLEAELVVKTHG